MAQKISDSLQLLLEIGESATAGGDLPGLFEKIVDAIITSLDVTIASLMLLEDDGALRIRAARGLPPEIVRSTRVAPGEGISGHVLRYGKPVLIEDLRQDSRFRSSGGGARYANPSLLSVPIRYQDRNLGVINVNNKGSGEVFTAADRDLLTAIAHHAALAVENFHLVTDLRRQTGELEEANRNLRRLHRARAHLLCNLSHELNTPLTSILGYTDLILNSSGEFAHLDVREYLQNVYEQGRRMDGLITGMLRLFSLDAGAEEWNVADFSLAEVITEVIVRRQSEIRGRHLRLETVWSEDLPTVRSDREKAGVLVDALVDNAIKFNAPGGRLGIRLAGVADGGRRSLYLQVHNDGKKVPAEAGADIFSGFHQLGNIDTEKPAGVGIGLATCRVIVERMRGRIFLEPAEGEGTTIGVLLPTC